MRHEWALKLLSLSLILQRKMFWVLSSKYLLLIRLINLSTAKVRKSFPRSQIETSIWWWRRRDPCKDLKIDLKRVKSSPPTSTREHSQAVLILFSLQWRNPIQARWRLAKVASLSQAVAWKLNRGSWMRGWPRLRPANSEAKASPSLASVKTPRLPLLRIKTTLIRTWTMVFHTIEHY